MLQVHLMGNDLVRIDGSTELEAPRYSVPAPERALNALTVIKRWQAGRSFQTLRAYAGDLNTFCKWAGYARETDAIDALLKSGQGRANELVDTWRTDMLEEGLQPATINRRLSAIRSLVDVAQFIGMCPWSLSVKGETVEAYRDTRGPSTEDVGRLLVHVNKHELEAKRRRDAAIILLMFTNGFRRNEVHLIDLADFDSRAGKMSVLGKGRKQREIVTLAPATTKAVRAWVNVRGREPGPLFLRVDTGAKAMSLEDRRLTGGGMWKLMSEWGDELGFALRPHGLRHSCVTTALEETGGNITAAMRLARHKNPKVTMRYDDNRLDVAGGTAAAVGNRISAVMDKIGEGDE
jgi:integrase/recombinase XerC